METKKELKNLIAWTKEYLEKNTKGPIKAIVGLSGGIDSAIIASICAKAVGKDAVLGVILPCESALEDAIDATELAQKIGIRVVDMDLEPAFRVMWDTYRNSIGWPGQISGILPSMNRMVKANLKSRLRMCSLYLVANHANALVVGTTNKSEAMIGYATKYGDGGVDIEPIFEYYKHEVYDLAKELGDVPIACINRAPSAGLWEEQTDAGEIGMDYNLIDHILECIEEGVSPNVEIDDFKKIINMINGNLHKDLHLPHYSRRG